MGASTSWNSLGLSRHVQGIALPFKVYRTAIQTHTNVVTYSTFSYSTAEVYVLSKDKLSSVTVKNNAVRRAVGQEKYLRTKMDTVGSVGTTWGVQAVRPPKFFSREWKQIEK